jgi:preprotein translocase subunit SecD
MVVPALGALVLVLLSGCRFGVEQYLQRSPAEDLSIRMVADDPGAEAELLPRLSGDENLAVETAEVISARHVRTVRLLDAADGSRVIVIDLDDAGRVRLAEASTARAGGRMAIVAGGRVIAAPTIRTPLTEGEAYVSVPPESLEAAFAAMSRE